MHKKKAGVGWSGLFDGETTVPRSTVCLPIELNKGAQLLCADGPRVYITQLDPGDRFN